LFNEIIEEAAKYAKENGIDFLLTDDSKIMIQPGTDVQIVQQLALRRMIYVNEAYDITDALIAWINAP
jgi:Skp family chaperone for outer membrane proteins